MNRVVSGIVLSVVLVLAASVFFTGITWGLPSRATDPFLLGADYHGMRLAPLTTAVPPVDGERGADVAAAEPDGPMVSLNDTDLKKARILCRYRLYSYQPDEMITFRALSRMNPAKGDLDPRLYQYGGLWVYGVGALIETARVLGWVELGDRALYIGNPEIFGRFYVVARAYSAAWGLVGVWAVFALVRRIRGGGIVLPACAAVCFISLPVVIVMAHEAKPHLAGLALILLAVLAADNFVQAGGIRRAIISGALCGAAAGMVLWGAVSVVVIAAMAGLARKPRAFFAAAIAAVIIYGVTNPYVIYHLAANPAVLASNLGNTSAMYHIGRPDRAVWNAIKLMVVGAGLAVIILAPIVALKRRWATAEILLAAVSIAMLVPFVAFAAGKPGEYGRFALLPDVALMILVLGALRGKAAIPIWVALLITTAAAGGVAHRGFLLDAGPEAQRSRTRVAVKLAGMLHSRVGVGRRLTLGVYADPAPYCLPPVDLDDWNIVRLRDETTPAAATVDVIVRPDESVRILDQDYNAISWADKQFEVIHRTAR